MDTAIKRPVSEEIKVSVIIPVYNVEKWIGRCLDSLVNQTLRKIEFIFINDCGTDNAIRIVEDAAKKDNRIRVLYNENNLGAGASRNYGIREARGKYIGFVDSDDTLDLNFYEELYESAIKYNADAVKGFRRNVLANNTLTDGALCKKFDELLVFSERDNWYLIYSYEHTTGIYSRELIKKHNIEYGTTSVNEDTYFLLQFMYYARRVAYCRNVCYYYHQREQSLTHETDLQYFESKIIDYENKADFLSSHNAEKDKSIQFMARLFWQLSTACKELALNENHSGFLQEYLSLSKEAIAKFRYRDELYNKLHDYGEIFTLMMAEDTEKIKEFVRKERKRKMPIAIRKLENTDIEDFENFLKTERRDLPELRLASLVPPHEDIAVAAFKKQMKTPKEFAEKYRFVLTEFDCNIISLSRHIPRKVSDNSSFIFSGYAFHNGKMLIGENDVAENINCVDELREEYGEFCAVRIGYDSITLSSDFFGMVPWFYFDNDEVFAASNNYHLMLLLLREIGVNLTMNIPRSRVNIITSGFTYGSTFSTDLDVQGCKVNLAYEEINYSSVCGVSARCSTLWDILSHKEEWNEDLYEEYIFNAKREIEENCRAAFECPRFDKIVVDVSGGFDSRIVFAAACNLPKRLRKKMYTHTRKSGTPDDIEKASAVTNLYNYPKYSYPQSDVGELFDCSGEINLAHISRTLGLFSVNSQLYTNEYNDYKTLELTGGSGDACFGYQRIRGELDYNGLGDKRLLARLGGCYLHNCVDELRGVFNDQEKIIYDTLENYINCDCLFKKFHQLYVDFRNRFNFGSAHNVENNNFRIPMAFSKYALKAKWMYFNKFAANAVPDEKISVDLLTALNPLMAVLPFAKNNDNVIPAPENLLNPAILVIEPDNEFHAGPEAERIERSYRDKVTEYMDDLGIAKQMLLHIYDYSEQYYPVCLGLYKVLSLMQAEPSNGKTGHGRETVHKIYDVYYQIRCVERN